MCQRARVFRHALNLGEKGLVDPRQLKKRLLASQTESMCARISQQELVNKGSQMNYLFYHLGVLKNAFELAEERVIAEASPIQR